MAIPAVIVYRVVMSEGQRPSTTPVNRTEEKIVEKIFYVNSTVEVPKIIYVNRTEIVHVEVPGPERIVEVSGPERMIEVPGPERTVYRDKIVEKIVELPKIIYVNRTEEKIVYVEVPGPERFVYRDKIVEKIVQVNHTVEKMVEVPKSIFVEKNLTEGTVCTCQAGYYSSTAGARV
jgi:hypothetical protein